MKKWILAALSVLIVVIVSSCKKDELVNSDGYKYHIEINSITLHELTEATPVKGSFQRKYKIKTDTSVVPITRIYTNAFDITLNGQTQDFYFNNPEGAISCEFDVKVEILEGGAAGNATISSLTVSEDKSVIFKEENITLIGRNTDFFNTPVYNIEF